MITAVLTSGKMCLKRMEIICLGSLSKIKVSFSYSAYRKVASSDTSRLEAHAGFSRLLIMGIFDSYVTLTKT